MSDDEWVERFSDDEAPSPAKPEDAKSHASPLLKSWVIRKRTWARNDWRMLALYERELLLHRFGGTESLVLQRIPLSSVTAVRRKGDSLAIMSKRSRVLEFTTLSDPDARMWCVGFRRMGISVSGDDAGGDGPLQLVNIRSGIVSDTTAVTMLEPALVAALPPPTKPSTAPPASSPAPSATPSTRHLMFLRLHLPMHAGCLVFSLNSRAFAHTVMDAFDGIKPPTVADVLDGGLAYIASLLDVPRRPTRRSSLRPPSASVSDDTPVDAAVSAGAGHGTSTGGGGGGTAADTSGCTTPPLAAEQHLPVSSSPSPSPSPSPSASRSPSRTPAPVHAATKPVVACIPYVSTDSTKTDVLRSLLARGVDRCPVRALPSGEPLNPDADVLSVALSSARPVSVSVPSDAADGPPCTADVRVLDLVILPSDDATRLSVAVPYHVRRLDAFGKPHEAFCITLRFNGIEWDTEHRHRDFQALHAELQADGYSPLPSFPITGHRPGPFTPKFAKDARTPDEYQAAFMQRRQTKLERYLQQLVSVPGASSNVRLLSWLGVVSTSRHDKTHSIVHLSKLMDYVRPGDVMLFACSNVMSGIQRKVTRSGWDHVGIVVRDAGTRNLHLLEVNGDGVGCYPLVWRVRCYGGEFTKCIAVRRLARKCVCADLRRLSRKPMRKHAPPVPAAGARRASSATTVSTTASTPPTAAAPAPGPPLAASRTSSSSLSSTASEDAGSVDAVSRRPSTAASVVTPLCTCVASQDAAAAEERLARFAASVRGKSYQLNLSKLWKGRKSTIAPSASRRPLSATIDTPTLPGTPTGLVPATKHPTVLKPEEGYFCSELVAAAYMEMGVMPKHTQPATFWPGSFATGELIDTTLCPGAYLEKEVVVDTREMSVKSAITL